MHPHLKQLPPAEPYVRNRECLRVEAHHSWLAALGHFTANLDQTASRIEIG